ncbi:MAG: acetolactate synthase small subunit [Kiritimatiellae bacterium]|nr:acetolactate synthase small subunit [Kiritimatiellia bacterium]
MKHTITALVENKPGVLARIVGLVSGRGYNIETLCVGPTQDDTFSKITMVVPGDDHVLEQVTLQLGKLVDVLHVTDVTRRRHITREMILAEIAAGKEQRAAVMELASMFTAAIVGVRDRSLTIQMTGGEEQVRDFLRALRDFKVLDIARSGAIAVARGNDDDADN